tara:strand:- start:4685 stop:4906 length:222 start_codon:yes stop_codon:yes gene_type:complete
MTVGGKSKIKVVTLNKTENTQTRVYSLCSEGNRRIIQSSYDEDRLQNIADMLNQEQELMTGTKYEKFFILKPL